MTIARICQVSEYPAKKKKNDLKTELLQWNFHPRTIVLGLNFFNLFFFNFQYSLEMSAEALRIQCISNTNLQETLDQQICINKRINWMMKISLIQFSYVRRWNRCSLPLTLKHKMMVDIEMIIEWNKDIHDISQKSENHWVITNETTLCTWNPKPNFIAKK